jgi:hypothetical protein
MGRMTRQIDWLGNGSNAAYDRTIGYNAKGQITTDNVVWKQGSDTYRTDSDNSYGSGTGYALGSITQVDTEHFKNGNDTHNSRVTNSYQWWETAVQGTITHRPKMNESTTWTSTYSYDNWGRLYWIAIADGRPRDVQLYDEADDRSTIGDPHPAKFVIRNLPPTSFATRKMSCVVNVLCRLPHTITIVWQIWMLHHFAGTAIPRKQLTTTCFPCSWTKTWPKSEGLRRCASAANGPIGTIGTGSGPTSRRDTLGRIATHCAEESRNMRGCRPNGKRVKRSGHGSSGCSGANDSADWIPRPAAWWPPSPKPACFDWAASWSVPSHFSSTKVSWA